MKRIKIFLRLKREETKVWWKEHWEPIVIIPIIYIGVMGIWIGLGFCICLIMGLPVSTEGVLALGGSAVLLITVSSLLCWVTISFKRWIQSNWKRAGELARLEREEEKT